MYKLVKEGSAEIFVPVEEKISKKLPVFYNPVMKLNRDITILLLRQFPPLSICDPMAASGIRAIRLTKELSFKSIIANDYNKKSFLLIKKNMKLNNVKFVVKNMDANLLLLNSNGFDFIDIDPFGTPNNFLDAAVKRISRRGILAVTATDTAALSGTYPKATLRKYWALPKKDAMMHETGLRILIRKIQLIGAQYEKALVPIFSYSKDHYFRVFLRCDKGKSYVDEIVKMHGMLDNAGPLWLGSLWDKRLVNKMHKSCIKGSLPLNSRIKKNNKNKELINFLKIIKEESKINAVGFYDIHEIVEKEKIREIMKKEVLMKKIKDNGFKAAETHFSGTGIRSDIPYGRLAAILKKG
ncbi:hypothetical protein J4458_04895 [Candidatus Woesearchaeota archaeon]|nr:hypothetical protein [Candidatus Woesearchaeota archaeon]